VGSGIGYVAYEKPPAADGAEFRRLAAAAGPGGPPDTGRDFG
jgi:hypothetical protein